MRQVLLADPQWDAAEAVITRADLLDAQEIVVCNALRGALPAVLVTT
jgi:para-aminobenzoate synthetase/4-amino-4-deoxychorismate lyase